MAQVGHRVFSGFFAALFLITSSALTIIVIISLASKGGTNSLNGTTSGTNSTNSSQSTGPNATGSKLSGFTPVADVTALKETDIQVGTGATIKSGDTITANYTGAVAATGVIFQSTETSGGQAVSFPLNQVIQGWALGIPGMKVGGTRQLLIPANLAYGANPPSGSGIPADAALVFNVTVEKIGN